MMAHEGDYGVQTQYLAALAEGMAHKTNNLIAALELQRALLTLKGRPGDESHLDVLAELAAGSRETVVALERLAAREALAKEAMPALLDRVKAWLSLSLQGRHRTWLFGPAPQVHVAPWPVESALALSLLAAARLAPEGWPLSVAASTDHCAGHVTFAVHAHLYGGFTPLPPDGFVAEPLPEPGLNAVSRLLRAAGGNLVWGRLGEVPAFRLEIPATDLDVSTSL